jgi:GNAT superfamily N-acetyltransferase
MYMQERSALAFRFGEQRDGVEVGRAWLYLIRNDIHQEPYGLLEDVDVIEEWKGTGIGSALLRAVIEKARSEGCYKLVATSRNDGTREDVHAWYERAGLKRYGIEFRMDLKAA